MDSFPQDLEAVRRRMLSAASGGAGSSAPALEALVAAPGKLLRPRLLCLSARACGLGTDASGGAADLPPAAIDLAAAVELLHAASLVHDDIIDGSPLRRGRPSLNALRGPRLAVLSGDWLLSRALVLGWNALGDARKAEIPFALALSRMVEGELSQSDGRFRPSTSLRAYGRRIQAKTALLFSLSCRLGAVVAGAAPSRERALARFGHSLGMAFQITDDILDFEAPPSATGKPAGADLAAGIYTLPVILALRGPGGKALSRLLERPPYRGRRLAEISRAIGEAGGFEAARGAASLHAERALRSLSSLDPGTARDGLASLCSSLPLRTS